MSARERLLFAKQVLFWLGVFAALVAGAYIAHGWVHEDCDGVRTVFEFVKVGLLPLAVLIVSFYFPRENQN